MAFYNYQMSQEFQLQEMIQLQLDEKYQDMEKKFKIELHGHVEELASVKEKLHYYLKEHGKHKQQIHELTEGLLEKSRQLEKLKNANDKLKLKSVPTPPQSSSSSFLFNKSSPKHHQHQQQHQRLQSFLVDTGASPIRPESQTSNFMPRFMQSSPRCFSTKF